MNRFIHNNSHCRQQRSIWTTSSTSRLSFYADASCITSILQQMRPNPYRNAYHRHVDIFVKKQIYSSYRIQNVEDRRNRYGLTNYVSQPVMTYTAQIRWHTVSSSTTETSVATSKANTDPTHRSDLVTMSIDQQGICTITLNRPQKLNALNIPMFQQLQSILHTILLNQQTSSSSSPQSPSIPTLSNRIRVILVRGEGRAFCTGLDIPSIVKDMNYLQPQSIFQLLLKRHPLPDCIVHSQNPPSSSLQQQPPPPPVDTDKKSDSESHNNMNHTSNDNDESESIPPNLNDAVQAIAVTTNLAQDIAYLWRQIHVPVIGCVHGMCYGGGLQMILGMDIRYVQTSTTKLSIMESKWGLIPDMGASITLRELIAIDIAKELTFTGRIISGEEALQYGLVTKCVDDPIAEGYKLAVSLVDKSPDVLRYSKQLYQHTYNTGRNEEECLQLENHYQNQLLFSYNQIVASLRTKMGWKFLPYWTTSSSTPLPPVNKKLK